MTESKTPFLWFLFSAGGTVAALFYPLHIWASGLAIPLGWISAPQYDSLLELVSHPLTRLYLLILVSLPLFHAGHRFRYTLYDGLKLKHLTLLIVVMCYGTAVAGTLLAGYLLWRLG
jgi:fumarate reductase subunit D